MNLSPSLRRLLALCRKESYQIVRDPSSILVAFILPVVFLFVMGYAINLDADHVRIGVLREDAGPAAVRFEQVLSASKAFEVHSGPSREALVKQMARGNLRGVVVIPNDFSIRMAQGQGKASLQVLADGSEPNTAAFVGNYVQGAWESWQQSLARDQGRTQPPGLEVRTRSWFNPSAISRNFLVPGSISVVMTIIGALLTSLVVAREWERGTMEALLATPVTRTELLVSKIIPYYGLGMIAMVICMLVAVFVMGMPFRGSLFVLFGVSTLFLGSTLGLGLFLSTVMRSQFNAALAALTAGFLPALMLSGFVFEISSMPMPIRVITRFISARYLSSSLQTLFQVGNLGSVQGYASIWLIALTVFWIGLTALKTRRTLD
ncbi:ABC transporter permease [Holophaga foetida]|uniref:ABC transporter permease n=1 Tax=Holophaga foetida TaxID=35839 RepID=UPI0002473F33|nr:ABC transporter permease [Holophaga foetida]